jgi:hypothetical protein
MEFIKNKFGGLSKTKVPIKLFFLFASSANVGKAAMAKDKCK